MTEDFRLPRLGKLRLLLTQYCNLNCLYCHKEGQFSARERIKPGEFKRLTEIANEFGLDEIKYSGGEPLAYAGLIALIKAAKELGIRKTSVTTNGILLEDKLEALAGAGLDELSISLDTLNPEVFIKLNRGTEEQFKKTLRGIVRAKHYPFQTNLNMSLTKYNVQELNEMRRYAREQGFPLRLISFIPLDINEKNAVATDSRTVFEALKKEAKSIEKGNTAAYTTLHMPEGETLILVDSSCFSCDVCGESYALRLTTDGRLKPCLISERGEIDVITPLREGDIAEVKKRFRQAIMLKKCGLMRYFDVSVKGSSGEYIVEE